MRAVEHRRPCPSSAAASMLKCIGAAAAASARGSERHVLHPHCDVARAGGGGERRAPRARQREKGTSMWAHLQPCRTVRSPLKLAVNRILTTVKRSLLALFAARAPRGALPARPRAPRVLAIHFTADVEPVTQDWLNHELEPAAARGLLGRGDRPRHAGRSRRVDAEDRPARAVAEDPRDRLRRRRRARAPPRPASGSPRPPTCSRWRRRRTSAPRRRSTATARTSAATSGARS